ncbi:hypothetical protein D3C81_943920 [compost metagenome]
MPAGRLPALFLPTQPLARATVLAGLPGGQRLRPGCVGVAAAVRVPGRALQPSAVVAVHPRRRCPARFALGPGQRGIAGDRRPDLVAAHRTSGDPLTVGRRTATGQHYPAGLRPTRRRPGTDRRQGAAVPPQRRCLPYVRPARAQPGGAIRPHRAGPRACRNDLAVPRPVRRTSRPPGVLPGPGREPALLYGHRPDRAEAGRRSPGRSQAL